MVLAFHGDIPNASVDCWQAELSAIRADQAAKRG